MTPKDLAMMKMALSRQAANKGATLRQTYQAAMDRLAPGSQITFQQWQAQQPQGLKKGGESKEPKHPAVYPATPAIPASQINSMAERMYRQMTGESNPNAKTQMQIAREKDLPIDVREHATPLPKPIIDIAEHEGAHFVGVPGDPSIGGMLPPGEGGLGRSTHAAVTLHGIGNKQFEHGVPQYGGEMYGAYGHPFNWAGGEAGVRPIEKAVKQLHKHDPEAKILGKFVKMTPQSLDFALHNLDTMLQYMEPHKLPREQREFLDRLLAELYGAHGAMPHSPGFADPHELLLQAQMDSKLRKKAVQILGTKKNMPAGAGSWEDVQYAISHPHLRNMETGTSGSTVMVMNPHESYKQLFSPNPTYEHELPSKHLGRTEFMEPAELAFPRSLAYAKEAIKRLPEGKQGAVQPFNMMKMIGMRELIDPQYIDQLGQYHHRMRQLMAGKAEGGSIEPSQDEMLAHIMLHKADGGAIQPDSANGDSTDLGYYEGGPSDAAGMDPMQYRAGGGSIRPATPTHIGVDEAPAMPVKLYMPPGFGEDSMPVGGVDFQPEAPGQQMLPGQPEQPQQGQAPGQPGQPGQPPGAQMPQMGQAPALPPTGGAGAPTGPQSNILQMTRQGQAMSAMRATPPGMPKMAKGGHLTIEQMRAALLKKAAGGSISDIKLTERAL